MQLLQGMLLHTLLLLLLGHPPTSSLLAIGQHMAPRHISVLKITGVRLGPCINILLACWQGDGGEVHAMEGAGFGPSAIPTKQTARLVKMLHEQLVLTATALSLHASVCFWFRRKQVPRKLVVLGMLCEQARKKPTGDRQCRVLEIAQQDDSKAHDSLGQFSDLLLG